MAELWLLASSCREKIVDDLYGSGAPVKGHTADILLGLPASGKSSVADPLKLETGAMIIDSDDAKAMLPEFEGGIGAMATHLESDALAIKLLRRATENGDNLILPLVGRGVDSVKAKIDILSDAGYKVRLHFIDLPVEKAVTRSIARFRKTGRLVDPNYVAEVGYRPAQTFEDLKGYRNVEDWSFWSNDVAPGEKPQLRYRR